MIDTYCTPAADLDAIAQAGMKDFTQLAGAHIYMTGCTAFLGIWLIDALLFANTVYALDLRLTVLTRDAQRLLCTMPHLAKHSHCTLLQGSAMDSRIAPEGAVTHIIHGANLINDNSPGWPLAHMSTALIGVRNVLELARRHVGTSMLFLSSGAVYDSGAKTCVVPFSEAEVDADSYLHEHRVYATSKYMTEMLLAAFGREHDIRIPIARCFTFMGAHMPLHGRQALGNFCNDVLHGRDITIQSSGVALRSYMYAADMARWLVALLVRGRHGTPYNVGSDVPLSIRELAEALIGVSGTSLQVHVLGKTTRGNAPDQYIPDTARSRQELNLDIEIMFMEGLKRTWEAVKKKKQASHT